MTTARVPGDALLLGPSRYRLKRIGRDEWLDACALPTDDRAQATDFGSAAEAALWLIGHVEQPSCWHWEEIFTAGW